MIDKRIAKTLDRETCLEYREVYQRELDLIYRRLERLCNKYKLNPDFESYDMWAGEKIDLPTRIEEQEAIKDELEWYLELIEKQLQTLNIKADYPN